MTRHPAKYSDAVMRVLAEVVTDWRAKNDTSARVVDFFAGTGRIHELALPNQVATLGIEIEEEWAAMHPGNVWADARHIWSVMRAVRGWTECELEIVSPTYGNRMADSHDAKDASKRNTYTHAIGHKLAEANTAKMQWGAQYKTLHEQVYAAAVACLATGGWFVLNVSNHIRQGVEVDVTSWHVEALEWLGLTQLRTYEVKTPRLRHGQNHEARVGFESVVVFEKAS